MPWRASRWRWNGKRGCSSREIEKLSVRELAKAFTNTPSLKHSNARYDYEKAALSRNHKGLEVAQVAQGPCVWLYENPAVGHRLR